MTERQREVRSESSQCCCLLLELRQTERNLTAGVRRVSPTHSIPLPNTTTQQQALFNTSERGRERRDRGDRCSQPAEESFREVFPNVIKIENVADQKFFSFIQKQKLTYGISLYSPIKMKNAFLTLLDHIPGRIVHLSDNIGQKNLLLATGQLVLSALLDGMV